MASASRRTQRTPCPSNWLTWRGTTWMRPERADWPRTWVSRRWDQLGTWDGILHLNFSATYPHTISRIKYFCVSFSLITTVQQFPPKLACAYILSLKPEQHWTNVYDLDLENDAKAMSATRKVMEKIRNQILNSLKDLGSMHELTESAEAAVNLMRTHLDLLEKARS